MHRAFCQALCISAAASSLASCNGSRPIGAPGVMPQSHATAQHAARGKSWMLPEAKNGDLLYALGGCNYTCVISYPKGKVVGSLSQGGAGICSDADGNVFISVDSSVTEYAHGDTTPLQTLSIPGGSAVGCSVDPKTNNLAVIFKGHGGDVAVFPNESGTPSLYSSSIDSYYCGYDPDGNLYVGGFSDGDNAGFAELPYGSSMFIPLTIDDYIGNPGQVQWDGRFITYQAGDADHARILQLSVVGTSAKVVHTTHLRGIRHQAHASWIFHGKVIVPYPPRGEQADQIGYFKYPEGGQPSTRLKLSGNFQGVTVSVAPH